MTDLHINTDRLLRELHHLATLTDCPPNTDTTLASPTTAVTRIVFTPRDLEARAYIRTLAEAAGFTLRVDAIGNTFIRFPGTDLTLPAVGTGSHTDAIPHAGMYDGTVGVLGGLEAMRSLKESGFIPKRSIETLMFTSEEPTRFGIGCIGSRLLGGSIDPTTADNLPDRLPETDPQATTGLTLHDVRTAAGFTASLDTVKLPPHYYHAWVELHIEQGPLLEREQIPIGIVTNIAAPASYRYEITGFGGHAGALLMPDRRDALCAAAETILSIEKHTLAANAASGTSDSVATVGTIAVHPGAINSVPSRVTLTLDIRDTDVARRNQIMSALHNDIREIESRRQVTITEQKINADVPAISDPHILATLESICTSNAIPYKKMVARAYHDTNFIAPIAPVAMLFIPCRNGVSHRPDEYATPESIALGTRVLALALAQLTKEVYTS
ncbi:M20 family metallo-hydrolase [Granulicella sp. L46]|uniref:M20 family metallo-hydrolase n=1 Tax=Granulicella sp. L46 TaxID=1641865 RepID=UPI00131CF41C|nr:M20 family metallo-hydrolase [Granulicella sp. L46]